MAIEMKKVFYVGDLRDGEKKYGMTDGVLREEMYLRINGSLINTAYVFPDTPEAHKLLDDYRARYRAWKAREPNVYEVVNEVTRMMKEYRNAG